MRPNKASQIGPGVHPTSDIVGNDEDQDENRREIQVNSTWDRIRSPAPTSRENLSGLFDPTTGNLSIKPTVFVNYVLFLNGVDSPCTTERCSDGSCHCGSASVPDQPGHQYERNHALGNDLDNSELSPYASKRYASDLEKIDPKKKNKKVLAS